jgi:type II secretory pathway pseudopilin PulG
MNMHKQAAGFTMTEILVSIFVMTMMAAVIGAFRNNIIAINSTIQSTLTGQQESRRTLRGMLDEVRGASTSSVGSYLIAEAGASSLTFYSNADADTAIERIRYSVSGTTLVRGQLKPTGNPLVYNVANEKVTTLVRGLTNTGSVFDYYDRSYSGTGTPLVQPVGVQNIRLVKVTLVIDHDLRRPPGPATTTMQISFRNLKDNL